MTLTMSQPSQRAGDSPSALRWQQLSARYTQVRQATMQLAAPLSDEDCQVQSMPDASPTKWHLAHVSWFFETFVLERHERDFQPFDARFRVLFNSYYEGVGEQHPRAQRGLVTRPGLATVKTYRAQVDQRMQALMANAAADTRFDADLHALITLGLHHEQQHQELLLTDIQHALWMGSRGALDAEAGAYIRRAPSTMAQAQPMHWSAHAGGLVDLGHDSALDGEFFFDNETPRHRVWLDGFEIASRPVNQGEFLAFMNDGGYQRPELWLSMGRRAAAHRGRMGACGAPIRSAAGAWRSVGMDAVELQRLPRLPACQRRRRRTQRQVHVQPVRAARRLKRHAHRPHPRELPQFLSTRRAVAVQRAAARASRLTALIQASSTASTSELNSRW